jgi:hypothetical protein
MKQATRAAAAADFSDDKDIKTTADKNTEISRTVRKG